MQAIDQTADFWSDTYRGRTIAILNHCGRWLVYLDHVLQERIQFATAEAARSWLQSKVDRRPSGRGRLH
jgi:hypothetical protein